MQAIKFNAGLPNGDFNAMVALAKRAEELGFYSVSIDDHFFMRGLMADPRQPHLECFTTLAAIAAATKSVRLVPLVTAMSYRNPALLAKMMATIDHISGGRLIAGLGAGWFQEEYIAYNYHYPSNAERIEQLADGIKVLKAMWTEDEPSYHGRFFSIEKAYCDPKPVQKPYPPILIGGGGKKILQIAAQEADILNLNPPVMRGMVEVAEALKFGKDEVKRRVAMLRGFAKAAGRSENAVELSGGGMVIAANDKSTAEAMIRATAQAAGVADVELARQSPMVLAGTFADVKRELAWRIENFGMSYFFLNFMSIDAMETFAKEVKPAFSK
ncbi:MAG TPA: TIGR03619 family F420-dependent LLM class oxidoreductase [Candidatus Binataceae bacterium]|nr:TIGR03619 family F420-dependent LLM class oxidoreductase [Candidatus Binataceae bacterium]